MTSSIQEGASGETFIHLLEDSKLTSPKDIADVLQNITRHLTESQYHTFLSALLSPPPTITRPAFELLLSSKEGATTFGRHILNSFPDSLEHVADSIHAVMLQRLSLFLYFSGSFERDWIMKLNTVRSMVEYSPLVIKTLLESKSVNDNDNDGEIVTRIKPGRQRKKEKKVGQSDPLDPKVLSKAFGVFGLDLDQRFSENKHYVVLVHRTLKDILQMYLEFLQLPKVAADLQEACIISRSIEPDEIDAQTGDDHDQVQEIAEVTTTPAAYPMVQPMKAALYFDSAEGFGEWRILISTRADRDLRQARRRDPKSFRIIVKKIQDLSNGHFSDDNQKRLNGSNTEVPIFEAKMTGDSRLIYQVDCMPEYNSDVERQVIKIFGVYTHAQIDKRLWDSVGHQLGKKGKVYRQRCSFRTAPKVTGDNMFSPACFPQQEQVEESDHIVPEIPRETLEEESYTFSSCVGKIYFLLRALLISVIKALLHSIIADLDVAHVFNVSSQEKEIIEYQRSCYVLGRSGTGKTTTMLFKMLGIERAYLKRKDEMKKPRQIFVTQSRVLAGKVEEYFGKLLDSLATAERTLEELAEIVKSKRHTKEEGGLIDIDDDQNWRGDLPKAFSELQDQHFPLFITFDRLASLLEHDIHRNLNVQLTSLDSGAMTVQESQAIKMVTYQTFLDSYWPHFTQNLVKGLDPALVFSELMGVIQGSEEALSHESRFLDKRSYESLSHRAQYAFANRREIIYSIFTMYLKQKRQRQEIDSADRTHQILKAFQTDGVPGQKIDYLYVDEAQDNLLIDAFMLRSLVRNPDGLFWAGDTAQTISVGSSFRFNDLKAFLFRLEKRREDSRLGSVVPISQDSEPPHTFHLAMNYRSHGGIVQCAHSVIELITEFWPYAIDILPREKGVVDGSKPVFFSGWDPNTVRYEQFLFGESGNLIEFGAQQCILVRDEAARDELRKEVGNIGLIMTLYESKGLEFDDVLLYKFFENSTVELSQWRVILNLLENRSNQEIPAPKFDEVKHAGVCSELKFLYVAITRARKNLWLVDCSKKSEPMRVLWTTRNEIQNCTPGTDVPRLAVSSSPEEWENSGRTLFANKRYLQAMHCFERAGMSREVAVSHTYYLREQARSISPGSKQSSSAQQTAFLEAAQSFVQCSGSATNSKEKKAYLRAAGDCFERADEESKAAEVYEKAEEYNIAAKLYRKCAQFDEAVAIVTRNRDNVDLEVCENIVDIAKLFYFRGGELEKASHLFDSVEEQLEYLEDFDLDIPKAALLEKLGKFQEAANIHFEEGRTMEAIRLFLMDPSDKLSIQSGISCVLQGLWEKVSFGVSNIDQIDGLSNLFDLASNIGSLNALEPSVADELLMFQLIKSQDINALRLLGRKFVDNKQIILAIMCLDTVFTKWPDMYQMTAPDISELISDFYLYSRLMQDIGYSRNPFFNPLFHKLFNVCPSQDMFLLREGTFIYESVLEHRPPIAASDDQGILVSEWELSRCLRRSILSRLAGRIAEEHDSCKLAPAFSPCILYLLNGHCGRIQCPRQHVTSVDLTKEWYTLQIRIQFQQLLIVDLQCALTSYRVERIKNMRYWIDRIYQTMYPEWFSLGGIANFDASVIPEAPRALNILYAWCHDLLYRRDDHWDFKLFTLLCQITKILIALDHPPKVLDDSFLANKFRGQPKFTYNHQNGPAYIIPMHTNCLSRINNTSLQWGILFVQHLLFNMVPIDANVLCDMIEHLCGSAVLVHANIALHNVHLPLSWLRTLFTKVERNPNLKPVVIGSTLALMKALRQLINSLHIGIESHTKHLLLRDSNLANPSLTPYRGVFVARVCRAMSFVGDNIDNRFLRTEILEAMKALKLGRPLKPYSNYAHVRYWLDVARLVERSTSGSALDGMIQLQLERKVNSLSPPPGMHRLVYKSLADIPRLLANPHAVISNLRANAPVFVPRPQAMSKEETDAGTDIGETKADKDIEIESEPKTSNDIEGAEVNDNHEADVENNNHETEVDNEPQEAEADNNDIQKPEVDTSEISNFTPVPSADLLAFTNPSEGNVALSGKTFQAAVKIQLWYRKIRKSRYDIPKTNIDSLRKRKFEECLEESQKIQWPIRSFYRHLFLGPLPHILTCLQAAHTWAMNAKKRNKRRFTKALHQDLEDIQKRLTDQKILLDEIRHLQNILNPPSELHRRRDIEDLKKRVLDVEALLAKLGVQETKHDMALGLKGIVAEPKPSKIKPRPHLRIDDDDNEYDEDNYHTEEEAGDANGFKENAVFVQGNEKEEIAVFAIIPTEDKPSVLDQSLSESPKELGHNLEERIANSEWTHKMAPPSWGVSENVGPSSLPGTRSSLDTLEEENKAVDESEEQLKHRIMQSLSWIPI